MAKKNNTRLNKVPAKKHLPHRRKSAVLAKVSKSITFSKQITVVHTKTTKLPKVSHNLAIFRGHEHNRLPHYKGYSLKRTTFFLTTSAAVLIGGFIAFRLWIAPLLAVSATKTITSQADWQAGEWYNNTLDTKTSAGDLSLKQGGGGTWSASTPGFPTDPRQNWTTTPTAASLGSDMTSDGSYLYMMIGNRNSDFWRFNPDVNTWLKLADTPSGMYYNGAMTYYAGYIYMINGDDGQIATDATNKFWRYDVANNTWQEMASAPAPFGATGLSYGGSDLESGNNGFIYAVQGNGANGFWIYNIAGNAWTVGPPTPDPISSSSTHALTYSSQTFTQNSITHCTAGCLFANPGASAQNWWHFDISLNQWYSSTNTPAGHTTGNSYASDPSTGAIYTIRGNSAVAFDRYLPTTDTWNSPIDPLDLPRGTAYTSLTYMQGKLYTILGSWADVAIYDIAANTWSALLPSTNTSASGNLLVFVPNGADCADASGCIFSVATTTVLSRFNISARTWTTMTTIPAGGISLSGGASMCYDGNGQIYMSAGGNSTIVHVYNVALNTYGTDLNAPLGITTGGSIACLTNDRFYLTRGGDTSTFYYFNGATIAADDSINTNGLTYINMNYGSALTSDGTYIYALLGNNRGTFLRFDPSQASGSRWTERASLPTTAGLKGYGTAGVNGTAVMEYDGSGSLYAMPGKYQADFLRYSIANNSWSAAADLPTYTNVGMGLTRGNAAGAMYAVLGIGSRTTLHQFSLSTGAYPNNTSWISAPIDLNYASAFTSFSATAATPGSTALAYQSRSSNNKVDWSSWSTISGGIISSPVARYIEVKIAFTSDATNTPTVSDFTITYTKDSTAPINPSISGYTDASKSTPITNASSSRTTMPYFEWTAPTQTESPLAGYYASWTTSSSDDPTTGETNFQTGTTYRANQAMSRSGSGTVWYFRIATKDAAGNISAPETKFQYTYNGVSAAASTTWTTQGDFSAGSLTNTDAATVPGSLKLNKVTNGAWLGEISASSQFGTGTTITTDGNDTIFISYAHTSGTFGTYTISTKTYTGKTAVPMSIATGGASIYVPYGAYCPDISGCVFIIGGSGTAPIPSRIYRYLVNANIWSAAGDFPNLPSAVTTGSALGYDTAGNIYYLAGGSTTKFYKLHIGDAAWSAPLADLDSGVSSGGALVYVPNSTYCSDANGCFFATQGGGQHFFRYRIQANTWTYMTSTINAVGDSGSLAYGNGTVYLLRGNSVTDFEAYSISANSWRIIEPFPEQRTGSAGPNDLVYVASQNRIYSGRGGQDYALYSYDPNGTGWSRTGGFPSYLTSYGLNGGVMAYDAVNNLFYIVRGAGQNDTWTYAPTTNTWKRILDVPHVFPTIGNSGGTGLFVDHATNAYDGVYVLVGNATGAPADNIGFFYRYNPISGVWEKLATPPGQPGSGVRMVFDGTDTMYAAQGFSTAWWKYVISTNTWTNLVGASQTIPGTPSTGSCALKTTVGGTDYIYLAQGNSSVKVYRYNLSTQQWGAANAVTDATGTITSEACFADGQGNLIFPRGNTVKTSLVLNPSGGTTGAWSSYSTPIAFSQGAMVMTTNNVVYGFDGFRPSGMLRYVVSTATTGYESTGTWVSSIQDLNGIAAFSGLDVTQTAAANTSLTLETRTCSNAGCAADANNVNWSSWSTATNPHTAAGIDSYTVNSSAQRYGQIRITYASDQVFSPTVDALSLRYFVDTTAPTNPATPVNGYTNSGKATPLANNTWSNTSTPYFEWTASDDTNGLGLGGFYVYFGTNSSKDPVTDAADPTNLAYIAGTNYYSAANGTTGSWNALTQSASALTDDIYYLRIRSADLNSNVAAAVTGFTYKYDHSNPADPSGLSVTPSGYSATNSYTFTWTGSTDVGPSDISQYCYKTNGTDTCVNAAAICTGASCSLSGITAYQTRVNTFYVRAKDGANNYSAYESTSYYYAGNPPTAPQSVTVTPGSQTNDNSFQVSWQLPGTCLGQTPCDTSDVLRYCYTINTVPDVSTCGTNYGGNPSPSPDGGWTTVTQTTNRLLPTFSAATLQTTNTIYVVAADAIGNVNYNNYTSQTFDFTSDAPGSPVALQATDSSDRASSRYSVTLTWDAPSDVGGGITGYRVYRCSVHGTDCDAPSTIDEPPTHYSRLATTSTLGYLDVGLDNTTTYAYFVRTVGGGNAVSGNSAVVTKKPEGKFQSAPALVGSPDVTTRIRSAIISWTTANDTDRLGQPVPHPATSFVQYGTTNAYGSETGTSDLLNDHSVTVVDLLPSTTYHYRLKWVDVDGNIGLSSDYVLTTLGSPSAPTSLVVNPTISTTNSFSFHWSAPADAGVTIGKYYYSVNSTPTANNTTTTTATSISAFAAATRQGMNSFYVVAADDAGNIDYSHYASVDFEVHTPAPSAPSNVTLVDSSDRDAKRYSLTITWDKPSNTPTGETIAYSVQRSSDNGANYLPIASLTSTGYLDTGLDSTTKYFYKITAQDRAQSLSTATTPVADIPEGRFTKPALITRLPVATPDSFSSTITWTTERETSSFVDFGSSASTLDQEQGTATQVIDHSVTVTGLQPLTTYFYTIKGLDIDQNVTVSETYSFTTLEAPRVQNVKISDVRLKDAIISWDITKEGTGVINYGTTTSYGLAVTSDSTTFSQKHSIKLDGLNDGTTYHVRLGGVDRVGNPIASDDYVFTTLTYPKVSDITTKNKSQGQTEVLWKTNVPTTSQIEYYSAKISPKTQGNTSLVTDHSVLLFGLDDKTTYTFKVRGSDQFGYEAVSTEQHFTTVEDTTPPTIFGTTSESNTVGSGDTSRVQIVISWKTDEAATSQVEYGVGLAGTEYTDATTESAELVLDHLVVISDLAAAKTYHYRVVSRDKAGNVTKSTSYSVLTSRRRESFLQLIIGNLENTFSWLGNIGSLGRK